MEPVSASIRMQLLELTSGASGHTASVLVVSVSL